MGVPELDGIMALLVARGVLPAALKPVEGIAMEPTPMSVYYAAYGRRVPLAAPSLTILARARYSERSACTGSTRAALRAGQ
ncbi:MAG TPA: hypothetical protein VNX22_01690 [Acidobacteriaceae bacterium]|nr:hypothetical protein [Acidobacteriaceae bacterium]